MAVVDSLWETNRTRGGWIGIGGVVVLCVFSVLAGWSADWKVVIIGWVAFIAMAVGAALGDRAAARNSARHLVWGYGLASAAMITSAAMFLVPQAIGYDPRLGGFGVAFGVLAGFGGHTIGHRLTHVEGAFDSTAARISAHALTAGVIIGIVYATLPELGLLLGLSIVSHKGPAGYAAARRLVSKNRSAAVLLLPAAGVGITAIPASMAPIPDVPALNAVIFGFAAGIFLHVAMDFLPVCETGSEIDDAATAVDATGEPDHAHERLDRLRTHAVASTALGGAAVFLAWVVVGV